MARLIGNISYLTVVEAATELKTTNTYILMLLRRGTLTGKQLDNEWYVERASIAAARIHDGEMKTVRGCALLCPGSCGCK